MAIPKCDVDWNQDLDNNTCAIILAGKTFWNIIYSKSLYYIKDFLKFQTTIRS